MSSDLFIHLQNRLFQPLEYMVKFFGGSDPDEITPVWIVGAPRSGTTLMYQLMCFSFHSAYLTNRVASRYRIAQLSRKWERQFAGKPVIPQSFQSSYGNTVHPNDPHEGGQFFYQFFTNDEVPTFKSEKHQQEFRKIISRISRPEPLFVSKNTIHSLRIPLLTEAFPKSRFIWVDRDPVAAAWSVYSKRQKIDGQWFGITPPGWKNQSKRPLEEQCLWQIQSTNAIIEEHLLSSASQYIRISYEEICSDPADTLQTIGEKLNISDHLKKPLALPESFSISEPPDNKITQTLKSLTHS